MLWEGHAVVFGTYSNVAVKDGRSVADLRLPMCQQAALIELHIAFP